MIMCFVVCRDGLYFQEVMGSTGNWIVSRVYATLYNDYETARYVALARGGIVKEYK